MFFHTARWFNLFLSSPTLPSPVTHKTKNIPFPSFPFPAPLPPLPPAPLHPKSKGSISVA